MERKFLYVFVSLRHHTVQPRCLMCPFCEVSSCDVVVSIFEVRTYFHCNNCNALAFAKPLIRRVPVDEIQKIYPYIEVNEKPQLWLTEFYFITKITSTILSMYKGNDVKSADVVQFSKNVYDYAIENNIDPSCVYNCKEFLHNNKIARKCNIGTEFGDGLSIAVNSFNISQPDVAYPKNMKFYCEHIFFWAYEEHEQFGIMWLTKNTRS